MYVLLAHVQLKKRSGFHLISYYINVYCDTVKNKNLHVFIVSGLGNSEISTKNSSYHFACCVGI